MARKGTVKILAGDIGGTKTELALMSLEASGSASAAEKRRYVNKHYSGIGEVIGQYLKETGTSLSDINSTCLGVAGVVDAGGRSSRATNIAWSVDAGELEERFGIGEVFLINDLEALGFYVAGLHGRDNSAKEDLHCLQQGSAGAIGNVAVIAAGTGLGECVLHRDGAKKLSPSPTEGGHTDFAPVGEFQEGLLRYLNLKYDHVSYERLLSGMGLENIYDYFLSIGEVEGGESKSMETRLVEDDRASQIGSEGVLNASSLAAQALRVFVSIYGAEAGNLALKAGAYGGVYIGGGIAPKIFPVIEEGGRFMNAFLAKGRMRGLLESIPVYLIRDTDAALKGAGAYSRMRLAQDR